MAVNTNTVVYILAVVISYLIIIYILIKFPNGTFKPILNKAIDSSEFQPAIFKIYDKSNEKECNRLIIVEPFNWMVLAVSGKLYILNTEGKITCGLNTTKAVIVGDNFYNETCLTNNLSDIISDYTTTSTYKIVPYNLTPNFNILSALNILAKDWITFDVESLPSSRSRRDISRLNIVSDNQVYSQEELVNILRKYEFNLTSNE